eukprot:s3568_g5.t1
MEVEMETEDLVEGEAAEVLRAREVANSVLASLKSQLTLLRESAAETQQRQWLRLSREVLQTLAPKVQAAQLKLRHEQLRQQREELEKKLKEGKIGLSTKAEEVQAPSQAGAALASAPSTATSRWADAPIFASGRRRFSNFDSRASTWDTKEKMAMVAMSARLIEAQKWFRKSPEAMGRCLDFGCGTGLLAFELQPWCSAVVGLDTSQGMLEVMQEKIAAAGMKSKMRTTGSLQEVGEFDLIVSMLCIHHVKDCALQLKELSSLLRPSGRLVIVDFEATENARIFHKESERKGDHYEHDGLPAKELTQWLKDASMSEVDLVRQPFEKERTKQSAAAEDPDLEARGPPPPKAKPKPKPKAAVVEQPTPPRTNGLVNINWKKKAAPGPEDFRLNDDFLREMAELRGSPMDDGELSKDSVFQVVDVPELSETQLQYWFGLRARQKRPTPCSSRGTSVHSTSRDVSGSGSSTPSHGPSKICTAQPVFSMLRQRLLDDRTIRSAGLFLARYRMNHGRSTGGASPKILVEDICKAVLQCRIRKDIDGLENLREAMETYAQAGSPVARFVEEQGLEALSNCDPEAEHRLLYQVSCIPGIYERLRCFKIQSNWDKDATKCKTDLQVLKGGLQVMTERKDVLRRFFSQAMRLGNKLNEAAGGPLAPHGFRMSSLETLMQTKSPWRPKLSLLHVILGLLDAPQVARLAELEQLDPIRAHGLLGKTSGVHERCRDLVMSLSKLRQLVAQVERKCCEKAVPDQQDAFHDYLEKFLENRRQEAVTLAQGCFDLYSGYKELAVFFGEPDAFYPPPVQSSDGAEDMFLFFHRFGEVVIRAQKEIDSMRFREELEAAREGGPEAAAQVAEEVAAANGMPIGFVKQRLLPEPVTRADAVLMTPPGSPCRVRTVASPCRGRASDKAISASARAVQRLKKMSATPEADAQSDVSDWEPNSGNRRSSGSPVAPKVSLGLPRRRLALPRERPQCCTPSSSASSPKWPDEHLEDDDFASGASHASRRRSTSRGCDEDPEISTHAPSDAANMEVVLSLPLPSTPTNRRSLSVPRGCWD